MANAAAPQSCRCIVSQTLLLLQSLLLFCNWVESGSLTVSSCTNEGFITQGPSSPSQTNKASGPRSSLIIFTAELGRG